MAKGDTAEEAGPWLNAQGWEYDLLRALPPEHATEVWCEAFRRGKQQVLAAWWSWPLMGTLSLLWGAITLAIWFGADFLGLGMVGRFALEIIFHLGLGYILHPVCVRIMFQWLRPFIRQELFRVAGEIGVADKMAELV